MVKEYNRAQRVAQTMHKEIAMILQRKVKDPRISMVTVSGINMSRDLTYAKVFVTFLNKNTPDQLKNSLNGLKNATGFIRNLLKQTMHLRIMPTLNFSYDNSFMQGIYISNLLSQVRHNKHVNTMVKKTSVSINCDDE